VHISTSTWISTRRLKLGLRTWCNSDSGLDILDPPVLNAPQSMAAATRMWNARASDPAPVSQTGTPCVVKRALAVAQHRFSQSQHKDRHTCTFQNSKRALAQCPQSISSVPIFHADPANHTYPTNHTISCKSLSRPSIHPSIHSSFLPTSLLRRVAPILSSSIRVYPIDEYLISILSLPSPEPNL